MRCILFRLILFSLLSPVIILSQSNQPGSALKIGRLKYQGGGDWYNDPQEEVNLLKFIRQNTLIDVNPVYEFVEIGDDKFPTYPIIFMTGHGNITLSENEIKKLRSYLENGGFLYADDDYGMDKAFRREIKKVFPEKNIIELPFTYGLYHCHYDFPNGPPKIHEHDNKPPQGFGILHDGRLVVYYTYESNPSDGWNDPDVHDTPLEKHEEALRFGTNIVVWALTH